MARRIFAFDDPDRFVAGALGEPGERTFYLQARQGGAVVSVVLEKAQVAALAGRLSELLDAVGLTGPATSRASGRRAARRAARRAVPRRRDGARLGPDAGAS